MAVTGPKTGFVINNNYSSYFNGSSYLSVPNNAAFQFDTGNFTIDFWLYTTSDLAGKTLIAIGAPGESGGFRLYLYPLVPGRISVQAGGTIISTTELILNAWAHYTLVRESNTFSVYVNGVKKSIGGTIAGITSTSVLTIGAENDGSNAITGQIFDLRIVKGTAVASDYSAPLLPISGTSLLTCRNQNIGDESPNNFTITNVGGVTTTASTTPFGAAQDLGSRYVSKDYLLDVYPNIVPGRTVPGLFVSGANFNGQLGLNDTTSRSSPTQVGSLTNWKQSALGWRHAAAVKTDGTLWAWGGNTQGQLGLGDTTNRSSPVQVGSLTDWKLVAGTMYHSAAIKNDGTLWLWGGNSYGKLGLGDVTFRSSPTQVGNLTNWKTVATTWHSTAAIKTDGTLWTWGSNFRGQLGIGDIVDRSSPVQVGSLTNWKQVYGGWYFFVAVKTDGTLWAWGGGGSGSLGVGDTTNRSSPVQVGSLTNWKLVSCGQYSCSAVKTDGTLWAWGANINGQLGLGNTTSTSSPVQVGSLTNWKQVSSSWYHTGAVKTDGTLWLWGRNSYGQLGIGDIVDRSSPVQVGSLNNWKSVAANWPGFMAIKDGYI